jgi:hypothetical protein
MTPPAPERERSTRHNDGFRLAPCTRCWSLDDPRPDPPPQKNAASRVESAHDTRRKFPGRPAGRWAGCRVQLLTKTLACRHASPTEPPVR